MSSVKCKVAARLTTCVSLCWSSGGVLKGEIEHKLGCSTEVA